MKKLLLLLLCVPLIGFGQSWEIQYLSNGYDFNTIYFYNDTIGFAVGDNGAMVKTTDAGDNWININTGITKDITDIQFISQDTGYICTEGSGFNNSDLFKTQNGGLTWISILSINRYSFQKISRIDLSEIILIGSYRNVNNGIYHGNVMSYNLNTGYTNDLEMNSYCEYYDSYFYSPNSYTLCGGVKSGTSPSPSNYIKTNISGVNVTVNYPPNWGYKELFSMDILDANPTNSVMVGNDGGIYNLSNMTSVNNVITENTSFTNTIIDLWSVDMMNDKGWIVGDLGTILFTLDSGQTWLPYNNPILFEDLHSVTFLDPCRGYFAGENGVIGRYKYQEEVSATICEDVQNYNLFNFLGSNAINLGGVWTDSSGNPISSMVNASNYSLGIHTLYYNYLACGSMTSSIVELEIVENPNLNILVLNNISCNGGNDGMLQVNMNNGSIIYANSLWSNGVSSPIFQNASAGQYSVQVTDTNGCSSTEAINISEPSLIVSTTLVTDVSCYGVCDGQIDINSVTGGILPYMYSWANGTTSLSLSSLCSGIYDYTIIDANGCLSSVSVIVNEPMPILVNSNVSSISCFGGNDGGVSVMPNGGTFPYSIVWNTSDTNFILNNLSTGLFTYTLIDNNNCSYSGSIQITEPALNVSNIYPVECLGGSFSVGSNTYSSSGVFLDTLTSFMGCDSIIYTNLVISPLNSVQNTISLCDGETVSVGSNIYSSTGVFLDSLISSSGCDSIVETDLTVYELPYFTISQNDSVLYLDSINANLPVNFLWSNGSINDTTLIFQSGNYTLVITDAYGCINIDSIEALLTSTSLDNSNLINNKVIDIVDVLGRKTKLKKNVLLFYIREDGTVDKQIIIE